ncbi:hypothetical protein [Polyangium sp. y55x31]|uniref:hypothetical protein n=1 Tax=Polyangium sp. y55x31 TaxID=3042688 RepID=UPI002482E272|nr:hypothetical protein [Polyangium sp. y55x31]MDI1476414.1 hypothetical protein [Polyangium sp. y55x31]
MNSVSDILAFVATQPDYWTDLLADLKLPKELSAKEREGLTAAREHIDLAVVTLLKLCASTFLQTLGEKRAQKKSFLSGATAKNRKIELNPPDGTSPKLYRLEFSLWGDAGTKQPVGLWATAVVKKKYSQYIQAELTKAKVEREWLRNLDSAHAVGRGSSIFESRCRGGFQDDCAR